MRRAWRAAAVAAAIVGVGACGGGDDDDSAAPAATASPATEPGGIDIDLPGSRTTKTITEVPVQQEARSILDELRGRQTSEGVEVQLEGDVLFDTGKSVLRPEAGAVVDKVVAAARRLPGVQVRLTGHTDDVGDEPSNLTLSRARAQSVADAIRTRDGAIASRLVIEGRGEAQPVAPNATPEGRQRNRRVTIVFVGARL